MNKTYAVPPPPPHNEGKTVAAWTMNMGIVIGAVLVAIGMVMGQLPVIGIGGVVIAVAIIVGIVLALAGLGQKRDRAARP